MVPCFHSNGQQHGINKQHHRFHRRINTACLIFHCICKASIYVQRQNPAEVEQVEKYGAPTLIQTSTVFFVDFFLWFELLQYALSCPFSKSSSLLFFWTVSLSWLSHNFINTSSRPGEHAMRPEDVCLEIETS